MKEYFYTFYLVMGSLNLAALLYCLVLYVRERHLIVHPKKIIFNQLIVQIINSTRFIIIGAAFYLRQGALKLTLLTPLV